MFQIEQVNCTFPVSAVLTFGRVFWFDSVFVTIRGGNILPFMVTFCDLTTCLDSRVKEKNSGP